MRWPEPRPAATSACSSPATCCRPISSACRIYDRGPGKVPLPHRAGVCPVVLADEINRATPKAQSALLEAMEERQVTMDGKTIPLPEPFFVIATQNPAHQVGTFPLPESQLDRFLMRIELGYPAASQERALLRGRDRRDLLAEVARRARSRGDPRAAEARVPDAARQRRAARLRSVARARLARRHPVRGRPVHTCGDFPPAGCAGLGLAARPRGRPARGSAGRPARRRRPPAAPARGRPTGVAPPSSPARCSRRCQSPVRRRRWPMKPLARPSGSATHRWIRRRQGPDSRAP
jgi:hypothetical protein